MTALQRFQPIYTQQCTVQAPRTAVNNFTAAEPFIETRTDAESMTCRWCCHSVYTERSRFRSTVHTTQRAERRLGQITTRVRTGTVGDQYRQLGKASSSNTCVTNYSNRKLAYLAHTSSLDCAVTGSIANYLEVSLEESWTTRRLGLPLNCFSSRPTKEP